MDPRRFDALTRSLLAAASRRETVSTLLAGLIAPLWPGLDAEGKRRRRHRHGPHASDHRQSHLGAEKKKKRKKKKKCKVKCGDKQCGPSNCKGKSCGDCIPPTKCNARGQCVGCLQGSQCASGTCCNEICCSGTEVCNGQGKCVDCLTSDDCGDGQVCTAAQHCCTPNCDGRRCGPDGCGGNCACPTGATCNGNGKCICDQPGQVVCNGACIEAECCADGVLPGVQCGDRCQAQPAPGLNCCSFGSGCSADEQCCNHVSNGAVCHAGECCQPIGADCGINTPCCEGFCNLAGDHKCTTCPGGGCCTEHEPGCPPGKQCCGQTCIGEHACCTDDTPGCPPGQKCCGGTCIDSDVCCTDGTAGACPTDRPHCFEGECVQCGPPPGPVCEFKPCTEQFAQCIDGTCYYSPGHEGDQCLMSNGQNGICCNGVCSGCCNSNPVTCPPPGACRVKGCENNTCTPINAQDGTDPNDACGSGVCCDGVCCNTLCCSGSCCTAGSDKMRCRSKFNSPCCYKGGVKPPLDTPEEQCCSGFLLVNRVCADE